MRHLTIVIVFISVSLSAQEEENWRTIPSVTEWIEEINNWPEDEYRVENIKVNFDYTKDSLFIATSDEEVDLHTLNPGTQTVINKGINILNLDFVGTNKANYAGRWLANLHFKESVSIYGLEDGRFGFINCRFDKLYQPRLMEVRFFYRHINCVFNGMVNINNPKQPTDLSFEDCSFRSLLYISALDATPSLGLYSCELELATLADKMENIMIDNCRFKIGLSMYQLKIENSLDIYNSEFGVLNVQGTDLPQNNTYISFDSLQNKLGLFWGSNFWQLADRIRTLSDTKARVGLRDSVLNLAYRAQTTDELKNKAAFDQLIASYYKLLNIYKVRGEMDSYNTAYIEMRDKQTARTKLLYEQDPSFNRYFDWQINRFTRAFSDYGTRPAKAIVIFFQVVLGFSVFYFFFPSSWNTTNSEKLMKRLSYLGGYFTSKEGLSDLFKKESEDRYRSYEEFRSFMESSEKRLPFYFQLLSKPLYRMSVARFNLTGKVLSNTEILNGEWSELHPRKKLITSFIVGLYLFFYLIYVLIIRILNAVTLSLNAFSTLGFGEIPTKGLARYVTIVQGFVGWFLLSIFLVSLIGQILN